MANGNVGVPLKDFASWVDSLQAQGQYFFTRDQALHELRVSKAAFDNASLRLARKKRITRLYRGFYIIIPLEYAVAGTLPPEWFIADLMQYFQKPYYVGLLSAARLHGAGHQQPQDFQVVTTAPVRKIETENLTVAFFTKKNFKGSSNFQVKVQTGFMAVSSPEETAFDLICYARHIGGLDRVLTVLQELGEVLDGDKLTAAAQAADTLAYAQRLGWLLETAGYPHKTHRLAAWVANEHPLPAKLEPSLTMQGARKNKRWSLYVNTTVEGDL